MLLDLTVEAELVVCGLDEVHVKRVSVVAQRRQGNVLGQELRDFLSI